MKHRLGLLFIVSIVSCTGRQDLSEKDKKCVIQEVRQTLDSYYNAIKADGLTAEFRYLDSSDDFFWVPPGYNGAISYDSVKAVINQNARILRSVYNHWDTLRIVPVSGTVSTYTGRLSSIVTDTSGRVSRFTLLETGVMVKRNEGWKLYCGQTNMLP